MKKERISFVNDYSFYFLVTCARSPVLVIFIEGRESSYVEEIVRVIESVDYQGESLKVFLAEMRRKGLKGDVKLNPGMESIFEIKEMPEAIIISGLKVVRREKISNNKFEIIRKMFEEVIS